MGDEGAGETSLKAQNSSGEELTHTCMFKNRVAVESNTTSALCCHLNRIVNGWSEIRDGGLSGSSS